MIVEMGRQIGEVIDDELDVRGMGKLDDSLFSIFQVGFDGDFEDFLSVNRSQWLPAGCESQYQRNRNVSQPQGAPNEPS